MSEKSQIISDFQKAQLVFENSMQQFMNSKEQSQIQFYQAQTQFFDLEQEKNKEINLLSKALAEVKGEL